jgi:Domain of unknown function (DUF4440)
MSSRICVSCLLLILPFYATSAMAQTQPATPSKDAAAIRAHIESIFQAFIDGDEQEIYDTHSEDWRGFLEHSRQPIKGINEYMHANGIDWPRPASAPKSTAYWPAGTTYFMNDFDVNFYSPDLAVASFFGGFERTAGDNKVTLVRFRIMDVYAKRKGSWIQVASHTVIDPEWRAEQISKPLMVDPQIRRHILATRESVWRAWFTNDRKSLEKLIPEEVIAIDDGSDTWSNRAAIFAAAQDFAERGGKLVKLEFPKTEMQVYGNTIIIYTTYVLETEVNGKRDIQRGRATEMFVRRGHELVNVGWHLANSVAPAANK